MTTHITIDRDYASWHAAARQFLASSTPPASVEWCSTDDPQQSLASVVLREAKDLADSGNEARSLGVLRDDKLALVPREFLSLARRVACHRDPARWDLLYRVLWRLTHGERELLRIEVDDDVHRLLRMDHAVRRDHHKMTAFVRFRSVESDDGERFIAWHRPDHFIVKLAAPFFARRFSTLRWTILTPDDSVSWDGASLSFGPGVSASHAPQGDALG